ncbi:MAG: flocculation-associated PEP-CTERM protein PepA [Telluria sp.]
MISVRKLAPLALAIGMTFAGAAQAQDPFNLKNGAGGTIVAGATSLDWNERGSGVAIGAGPFNDNALLPPGTQFDFKYQANLVTVGGGTPTPLILGLDGTSDGVPQAFQSYEFTIVAKLREVVTSSALVGGNPTAFFGLAGTNADNKVAIYYDTARNANTATGTGFDDGTLIALLTITPGAATTSQFSTIPGTGTGQGSAKLAASIVEPGDFIDDDYLEGITNFLFGMNFESNLNYPSTTSNTTAFHMGGSALFGDYAVGANDIVFKVDGTSRFTAVPEPGSMVLLGAGLLGFLGMRRRSAKKA